MPIRWSGDGNCLNSNPLEVRALTICIDSPSLKNAYIHFYTTRDVGTMSDLIGRLEATRRRLAIRQADLASALEVTQGHYSKVVRARTPLTEALSKRISRWIEINDPSGAQDQGGIAQRMAHLAASIQEQCAELLRLSTRASSMTGVNADEQVDGRPERAETRPARP